MAGKDRSIARQRAGHNLAAIITFGLFLSLVPAGPLRADYVITGNDGKVARAGSYFIQGDTLHVYEGTSSFNVYDITSVTAERLTPDEVKRYDTALKEFRKPVNDLLAREETVADAYGVLLEKLIDPPAGKKAGDLPSKEKKAIRKSLEGLKGDTARLMEAWRQIMLPDFSLLLMRDIKKLELLSLESSIEQSLKYVGTGDPTCREYAKAYMSQALSFEKSFRENLPWKQ